MIAHINIFPSGQGSEEQTVKEHLEGAARIAKRLGASVGLESTAWLTAVLHDLGKWRKAFEEYIRDSAAGNKKAGRGTVNHSSAGAIFVYQRYYQGTKMEKLTAQLISQAILSHHGLNDCMSPEGENLFQRRVEGLDNLDYEEVAGNLKESGISMACLDENFAEAVKEVELLYRRISDHKNLKGSFSLGLAERLLLSVLIDADRLDTAIFCGDRDQKEGEVRSEPPWELLGANLEKKLEKFPKTGGIAAVRRRIADECLEFSTRISGIYRLAVPTGGAKTLSSMRYAVNHAKKYGKKRIFYIGPYLSILEQNSKVFMEALDEEGLVLEHHSNVFLEDNEEEGDVVRNYRHLTENWDIPVVITTFVQFLNTLFAGNTGSVRRFHSLADSVIIIDEIQSLPIKMIHMFNTAMNFLNTICHTTVILCSATQPVLEKVESPIDLSQPPDMIADVDKLYRQLKRVRIEGKKEIFNTGGLCGFLEDLMEQHGELLVILNTKKAARLVYERLKSDCQDRLETVRLIHLSTNMCPEHRLKWIEEIKGKKKGERLICVSTSLIEAGVDLSFSCVVRSYAGLDSIAQAAGRCNRNQEASQGAVWLVRYEEERLGRLEQTRIGAEVSQAVVELFEKNPDRFDHDLLSRPALEAYYDRYYYDTAQKTLMNYRLAELNTDMMDLLGRNAVGKRAYDQRNKKGQKPDLMFYQAFKTAGRKFCVIDQNTVGVLVPFEKGKELISGLSGELYGKELTECLRECQRFMVNLYRNQLETFQEAGALVRLGKGEILALKEGFYDDALGVTVDGRVEFLEV